MLVSTTDLYKSLHKYQSHLPTFCGRSKTSSSTRKGASILDSKASLDRGLYSTNSYWDLPFEIMCEALYYVVGAILAHRIGLISVWRTLCCKEDNK